MGNHHSYSYLEITIATQCLLYTGQNTGGVYPAMHPAITTVTVLF